MLSSSCLSAAKNVVSFFLHFVSFFLPSCPCFAKANSCSILSLVFRFAQFFIKPLMSPDATLREIKAVDSGICCLLPVLLILMRGPASNFSIFLHWQKTRKIYCQIHGE